MFKHILVPLDGSPLAEAALPAAEELAKKFSSEITLLRVTQPPYHPSDALGHPYSHLVIDMRRYEQDESRKYLNGLKGSLRSEGYKVHIHVIEGRSIANTIIEVAAGLQVDSIVMSTHGRGGVSRWMFGSVADKVLRLSKLPIVLIRAKEEAFELPVIEDEKDLKAHEIA